MFIHRMPPKIAPDQQRPAPIMADWADEEADNPSYAHDRNIYKLEKVETDLKSADLTGCRVC
jgi:hypothetical protein